METNKFVRFCNKNNEEQEMLCPICHYNYTHLEKVEEYREKDNRLCVKLYFFCEDGCRWVLDFHQHEGMTYPYFTELEDYRQQWEKERFELENSIKGVK